MTLLSKLSIIALLVLLVAHTQRHVAIVPCWMSYCPDGICDPQPTQ
jgi:hypothetical protein